MTRYLRILGSVLTAAFSALGLVPELVPATAGEIDGINLSIAKGPAGGQLTLSWTGRVSPFAVYRGSNPATVTSPGNKLADTFSAAFTESIPPGAIIFYRVEHSDCQIQADPPELTFADTNCDGIDGNASAAIFVDVTTGIDSNPGTMAQPKRTITAAIAAAAPAGKAVYISQGLYAESVVLANGVSLYGGYNASSGWMRSNSHVTTIQSPTTIGALGSGLTQSIEIQLLRIESANASGISGAGDGLSSYGVLIRNSSAAVVLRAVRATSGTGADGASGANGTIGATGGTGGNATGGFPGNPGMSACGVSGGMGGTQVDCTNPGNSGQPGSAASGGGVAGPGGSGGSAGSCSASSSSNGAVAPPVVSPGGVGGTGPGGTAGPTLGSFDASGGYLTASGVVGSTGFSGGGGGGGGSGGGTRPLQRLKS